VLPTSIPNITHSNFDLSYTLFLGQLTHLTFLASPPVSQSTFRFVSPSKFQRQHRFRTHLGWRPVCMFVSMMMRQRNSHPSNTCQSHGMRHQRQPEQYRDSSTCATTRRRRSSSPLRSLVYSSLPIRRETLQSDEGCYLKNSWHSTRAHCMQDPRH
jgi:hypothetical protein